MNMEFEKWNNDNKAYYPLLETTIKMERMKAWKGALKKIKDLIIENGAKETFVFIKQELQNCKFIELGIQYDTPPDPQHGREPDNKGKDVYVSGLGCVHVVPDKVKPLAQYLGEYLFHDDHTYTNGYGEKVIGLTPTGMIEILEQALDAYQSTENVTIKIERI